MPEDLGRYIDRSIIDRYKTRKKINCLIVGMNINPALYMCRMLKQRLVRTWAQSGSEDYSLYSITKSNGSLWAVGEPGPGQRDEWLSQSNQSVQLRAGKGTLTCTAVASLGYPEGSTRKGHLKQEKGRRYTVGQDPYREGTQHEKAP